MITDNMLKVENLYKTYDGENIIIDNLTIEFEDTGFVFLLGKSGSGKTTLLNLLGGIDRPTSGEISLSDKKYSFLTDDEMDEVRNIDIAFVFQEFNLLNDLNVIENVMLPLKIQSGENDDNCDRTQMALKVLEMVGLSDYAYRMPNELSGGQIQRVAIARAMIKSPKVLLADEPTGNLDSANSKIVFEELKKMSEKCLVIVVSHDEESAYKYGSRVIKLVDGKIVSDDRNDNNNYDIEYEIQKDNQIVKMGFSEGVNANETILKEVGENLKCNEDAEFKIKIKHIPKVIERRRIDAITRAGKLRTVALDGKDVFLYARNNMKNHKRYIFSTIIMMTLTIMLIMLSSLLSGYRATEPIEKYIREYQLDRVNLKYITSYTNRLEETKRKNICIGERFEETLGQELANCKIDIISDISVGYNDEHFIESEIFALKDQFEICDDIELKRGEVVITDYVARKLQMESPIGKYVTIGSDAYKVVGCISIDEKRDVFDLNDNVIDNYEEYYLDNYFNVVFIRKDDLYSNRIKTNSIILECADFLNVKYERYFSNEVSVGAYNQEQEIELLYGRYPEKANEILISEEYAIENGILSEDGECLVDFSNKKYSFIDAHMGYGDYYTDVLNMYEYYDGDVSICGVYRYDSAYNSYLVHNDVFEKMLDDYGNIYVYDRSLIYINEKLYDDVVTYISRDDTIVLEPSIGGIYEFENLMKELKMAIIFVLTVLIIIAIFMVYYNLNISISNNKKLIGVLRSIGVSKKCTIKIFLVEAVVICTIACTFAAILSRCVVWYINDMVRKEILINPYDILYWNNVLAEVIIILTFLLFLFTAIIPIYKYAKKPPIQVIRL